MDINYYQEQVLGSPPCWQLVTLVYMRERALVLQGYEAIAKQIRQLAADRRIQLIADAFRMELHKGEHGFRQIAQPVDLAVVLMGLTPRLGLHHCGIYHQGNVLHALDCGTLYQDMNTLRAEYRLMEFWIA